MRRVGRTRKSQRTVRRWDTEKKARPGISAHPGVSAHPTSAEECLHHLAVARARCQMQSSHAIIVGSVDFDAHLRECGKVSYVVRGAGGLLLQIKSQSSR